MIKFADAACACEAGSARPAAAVNAVQASNSDLADVIVARLRIDENESATTTGAVAALRAQCRPRKSPVNANDMVGFPN
jgi:hypothetical protein